MRRTRKKVNYLSNKDILVEIHKSKCSYCYFVDEDSHDFSIILQSLDEINEETIQQAKENRFKKQMRVYRDSEDETLEEPKLEDIKTEDLVFRILTLEHIPLQTEFARKPRRPADYHVKTNFTAFKHYKLDANMQPYEVGRSHWVGGFENGYFSVDHGNLTKKLAWMFFELVRRYSQKGNWRGYSYLDDMKGQALLQLTEAALKFEEHKSDNPFAYYTQICLNSFRGTLNSEEKVGNIKDKILIDEGMTPSFDAQLKNEYEQRGL